MAKTNITLYSSTPSENTDIDDINIDELCPASNLNNALRSLLSHLKNVDTGSQALTALSVTGDTTISSGNLLVGNTTTGLSSAGINLHNNGTFELRRDLGSANVSTVGYISRGSTDGNILTFYKDTSSVGSIGTQGGTLEVGSGDVYLQFNGTNDWIKPVDGSGSNKANVDLGTSGARFQDLYLSGGVYLGGTGSANKLDDYEEGTWTPSTSTTSYTVSSSIGRYTKIGRIVVAHFSINFSAVNSSSNSNVFITGFPFTSASDIAVSGSVRESSNTGAIYATRIGGSQTGANMNSMDNTVNGSQRTIRTSEDYVGSLIYMT